jgi:hypothetical protein
METSIRLTMTACLSSEDVGLSATAKSFLTNPEPNGRVALFSAWLEVSSMEPECVDDAIVEDTFHFIGRICVRDCV